MNVRKRAGRDETLARRGEGREPEDGVKAKTSLDWDSISSLQSPVSAARMGSSVIFGLQLQKGKKKN